MFFWRKHPIRDVDLSAYVDGQLEPPACDRLEVHIETCTPCREALAELRALRSALQELPPATAPRSFALREADVRAEPKPSLTPARPPALLGGLASVALVAFVALVGVDVLGQPSAQRDADATGIMSPEVLEEDADLKISTTGSTGDLTDGAFESDGVDGGSLSGREATPPDISINMSSGFDEGDAGPETDRQGEIGIANETTYSSPATPECPPDRECRQLAYDADGAAEAVPEGMLEAAPEAAPGLVAEPAGDSRLPLRVGEAAAAAVALVAGGSFALIWRRRRV